MLTPLRWTARPVALAGLPFLLLLLAAAAGPTTAQEPLQSRITHVSPGDQIAVMSAAFSPDGRWIVYSRMSSESNASLWVMPAAGGESVRLTEEGHWDDNPVWSPDGTRLYFRSNRPARGTDGSYGMVMAMNPATGRATSSPRQVTAGEIAPPSVQPSPDGRWVAHTSREGNTVRIQVIPASGGNARTVAELNEAVWNLGWTTDGEVLYSTRPGQRDTRIAYRVPATGGTPTELLRVNRNLRALGPDGETFAVTDRLSSREASVEVLHRDGRVLARQVGDSSLRPVAFARDGRTLMGVANRVHARIRIAPVAGGGIVDLTPGDYYDWHAGWSPDASEVRVLGAVGDREVLLTMPRTGGAPRGEPLALPTDEEDARWGVVGERFALYHARIPGTDRRRLVAIDRRDGSRQVLSEDHRLAFASVGAGGLYDYGDGEFLFVTRANDRLELRGFRPGGGTRLIRAFPTELDGRTTFAVAGDRVAWYEQEGDTAHLYLADGPDAPPARLLSSPLGSTCCRGNLVFSRDGRRLLTHDMSNPAMGGTIIVLDLTPDGQRVQARRTFDTGASYWYESQWLPDDNAVAVLAGYEGLRTHVLLVPLREGETPINLTRDDPAPKWGFSLSPDGRYIAYPSEVWQGGTIWTMELAPGAVSVRERR
jgi:Tol biopolymer transport system component